jgi:hypothetical protein
MFVGLRLSMVCLGMSGYVWVCLDMSGYVWICLDISGYLWMSLFPPRTEREEDSSCCQIRGRLAPPPAWPPVLGRVNN